MIPKPAGGRPGRHPVACETLGRPRSSRAGSATDHGPSRATGRKGGWKGHGKSGLAKKTCLGAFGPIYNDLAPITSARGGHHVESLPEFLSAPSTCSCDHMPSARRLLRSGDTLHRRPLYREHPKCRQAALCWLHAHGGCFVPCLPLPRPEGLWPLASGSPLLHDRLWDGYGASCRHDRRNRLRHGSDKRHVRACRPAAACRTG